MPAKQSPFGEAHISPHDLPEFPRKLALICRECGKKGNYSVGRVLVDPSYLKQDGRAEPPDDALQRAVSFAGIFHCRQCGASGPWDFPSQTLTWLLVSTVFGQLSPQNRQITPGLMRMHDGTIVHTGAEAEAFLQGKLTADPDDAFLWSRLGNLYDNAGRIKQARKAYERAVELDPGEIESNYTLGCYRMEEKDTAGAAEHFQRVALSAGSAQQPEPKLLKDIVRDTLERLFDLNQQSDGDIPFPPEFARPRDLDESAKPDTSTVYLTTLDLGTDEGWDVLTTLCLNGRVPESARGSEVDRAGLRQPSPTSGAKRRIGRNEPCPCGSGKKHKRCCGRGR